MDIDIRKNRARRQIDTNTAWIDSAKLEKSRHEEALAKLTDKLNELDAERHAILDEIKYHQWCIDDAEEDIADFSVDSEALCQYLKNLENTNK